MAILPNQYDQLINTVITYYSGTCATSGDYLNTVNQMLPVNPQAFIDLGFALSECYAAGNQVVQATQLLQQIQGISPGNGAIRDRVQYTISMLNIKQNPAAAAPADIATLTQLANGSGDYAPAACVALMGLVHNWPGNCFGAAPTARKAADVLDHTKPSLEKAAFTNAPNPFSQSTVVMYQLTADVQQAVLKIYDIQGKLVRVQPLDVNTNETTVYAEGLHDGVYIYTIETDGTAALGKKRMVIIR